MRFLSLVGKRFGNLTVMEKTTERFKTYVVYECKCDCGNVLKASVYDLKYCKLKSCKDPDCPYRHTDDRRTNSRVNLAGKRFGKLVCIEKAGYSKYGSSVWKVKCDCGNIDEVPASWLMHHGTTSCKHCRFDKVHGRRAPIPGKSVGRHKKVGTGGFYEWLDSKGVCLGEVVAASDTERN